jgi:hypothetical protein
MDYILAGSSLRIRRIFQLRRDKGKERHNSGLGMLCVVISTILRFQDIQEEAIKRNLVLEERLERSDWKNKLTTML